MSEQGPEPDPAGVALELVLALQEPGLPCAIGGSIALGVWECRAAPRTPT